MRKKYTQEGPTLFDSLQEEELLASSKNWKMEYNADGLTKEVLNIKVPNLSDKFETSADRVLFVEPYENKELLKRAKISEKLRSVAESLRKQAEGISTEVHGNWTHRRQSFADNARNKKDGLIADANVFEALSVLWNANQCPRILEGIRSRGDLDVHYPTPPDANHGKWYHDEYPGLLKKATKLGLTSKEDSAEFKRMIQELRVSTITPEDKKKRELENAITAIRGWNIPGFFPTPDNIIDTMLEYASIEDGMTILEPSAGIGSIADRIIIRGYKVDITCVEVNHSLAKIIALKGHNVVQDDILSIKGATNIFDKVIMNPPFEKGQDMEHVRHCYDNFLKKGGTLVSIMSTGVMNNSTKKYVEFREWVEKEAGVFIELGQVFKDSFRSTGISVIILMIEK